MLARVTPVLICFNEAANIERTLAKLQWAKRVVLVDSHSVDETVELAKRFDNVEVYERKFDHFAGQWSYAIHETNIDTEWVLALDSDYVLTDEFIEELKTLDPADDVGGYWTKFIYCVYGHRLRGSLYPPVTTLYRRSSATYTMDGHTQRVQIEGRLGTLNQPILHDDHKPLKTWLWAQDRYSYAEAEKLRAASWSDVGLNDKIRKLKVVAPLLTPLYCLIVRGGILDGKAGLFYATQRTIAELVLSLHLLIPQRGKR